MPFKHLPTRITICLCIGMASAVAGPTTTSAQSAPPVAERHDVTETLYGQVVVDPYRSLEDWHDAKVAQWLKGQDDYTRATLNALPGREKFLERIKALDTASTRVRNPQAWGGKTFYLKAGAGADNVKLYVIDRAGAQERLLIDPELLTKDGVHYSIDYFQPSLDGALVAYGISAGGSENSVIHILETASGKSLPDAIDRTRFGGVMWLPGN